MATPERSTAPGTPAVLTGSPAATGPVPVMAPLGWLLILVAGAGLILASWLVYGDGESGMWAGYRDGFIGTIVVLAAMGLHSSLPKVPLLGLCGVAGILLVLFAVFLDNETAVFISELTAGIVMLIGVGLFTSGRQS